VYKNIVDKNLQKAYNTNKIKFSHYICEKGENLMCMQRKTKIQTKKFVIFMLSIFVVCLASIGLLGAGGGASGGVYLASNPQEGKTLYNEVGDGSAQSPYLIGNADQLKDLANRVNGVESYAGNADNMSGIYISLTADIDLSAYDRNADSGYMGGKGWNPIGNSASNCFSGIFDGGGFTVSNIYIDINTSSSDNIYVGLFGYINYADDLYVFISYGAIKNLGVSGEVFACNNGAGSIYAGGIAGYVDSLSGHIIGTIAESYSACNVIVAGGIKSYAGGISGYLSGDITSSHNTGSVTASGDGSGDIITGNGGAGGIVGYLRGSMRWIYNTGNVRGYGNAICAGGIGGYLNHGSIADGYNTGRIETHGSGTYAGGIAGYGYEGSVAGSYNTGSVGADGDNATAGGIAGCIFAGNITGSYNMGDVTAFGSGYLYAGGIAGIFNYSRMHFSYNKGEVRAIALNGSEYIYAGGIVGSESGTLDNGLTDTYNMGAVSANGGRGASAGGIAGHLSDIISRSYNAGTVSATCEYGASAGGIIGGTGTIRNSYNTGAVSATGGSYVYAGGIAGAGDIIQSYSAGTVSASGSSYVYAGGIAGIGVGTITNSFYNKDKFSGSAAGDSAALTDAGLTTAQMTEPNTLMAAITGSNGSCELAKRTNDVANGVLYYPELAFFMGNAPTVAEDSKISVTVLCYGITYNGVSETEHNNPAFYAAEAELTLAPPTRAGYTFEGWYTDAGFSAAVTGVAIAAGSTGNKEFWAKWRVTTYTITYNNVNGAINPNSTTYTVAPSDKILFALGMRVGYAFGGWYDNAAFNGVAVTRIAAGETGNKEFWAKWTAITYTITYNDVNGATNPNPTTYTIASATISLAAPTLDGYDFDGWYDTVDFSGVAVISIAQGSIGNRVFYAKWKPVHFGGGNEDNNLLIPITATGGGITVIAGAVVIFIFHKKKKRV
jgi:uncharacterized repeat protein (TIGR02543 family)